MKKVLYITNTIVPYRVEFFNLLSKKCELTVVCEREKSKNRNEEWTKTKKINYKIEFLKGIRIKNENAIDLKIFKYIFNRSYDAIIFGCYNSFIQMLAILVMKIFKKKYYLNLDGEVFATGNSIKDKIKRFFIKGAEKYLVAGEKSAESIRKITYSKKIYPYYLSSLTEDEIKENLRKTYLKNDREEFILAVGQFFDYKGLDILLRTAKRNANWKFKFIGMGNKTDEFLKEANKLELKNIEVIPFLQKEKLEKEYLKTKMLILPSRQECWGLVINEAASLGTPIVSTYGSGAAREFLEDSYNIFLARPNDVIDLEEKIKNYLNYEKKEEYCDYLINKSKYYSIERNVESHMKAIESN